MHSLLYVEGCWVKVALEDLFCVPACASLWLGTFQPRLCNLLCFTAQPFWSCVGRTNPVGRGQQVSPQSQTEPCSPIIWPFWTLILWWQAYACGQRRVRVAKVLWVCLRNCCSWARQSSRPHPAVWKHCVAAIPSNLPCRSGFVYHQEEGKTPISVPAGKCEHE